MTNQTKEIKLLPCPFCGENEQEVIDNWLGSHVTHIRCEYCGALGPPADTRLGAKKEWNRRAEKEE